MGRARVEVFAEIACPFAHVGLRRIVRYREAQHRSQPVLWVRAWPLELVNGEPMDAQSVATHVAELREQVEPELFRNFDSAAVPTTSIPAFELAAVAAARSDALGEQVSLALRDALFEDGQDPSDPAVLEAVRSRFGLPEPREAARVSVEKDYAEGRRRGVRGSPEYFLDGRGYLCPSLRLEEKNGGLAIQDAEHFDTFMALCFH